MNTHTLHTVMTIVVTVVFVLFPKLGLAQEGFSSCGTVFEGEPVIFAQNKLTQARTMMNNDDPFVFKVRVNFIDGVVEENEKETNALDIVGVLNLYFNQHNFFFKYAGYVTREGLSATYNSTMANTYNGLCDNEYIEIFVVNTITGALGVTSTSFFSGGNGYGKFIVIRKSEIPDFNSLTPAKHHILVHEMGHYFGLHHPWQRWFAFNDGNIHYATDEECSRGYNGNTYYAVNENLDGSEWNTRGDFVEDTNPDRYLTKYKKIGSFLNLGFSVVNCELTENDGFASTFNTSCPAPVNTIDLSVFEPNISNFMGYPYNTTQMCNYEFTEGQVERMIAMINFVPFLNNKIIDIQELYEPYFVENLPSESVVSTQDFGTYALVCYMITARRYKFQKGFNYEFITEMTTPPTLTLFHRYEAPVIELFSMSGTDFTIQQIDENDSKNMFFICTRGMQMCIEEPYSGGRVGTTPVLGGSQFTITNLNQQEVTDPDLIDNLESQKYHIIEKETQSGNKTTQTIYKTN